MKKIISIIFLIVLSSCCDYRIKEDAAIKNKLIETKWLYKSGYKNCGNYDEAPISEDVFIPFISFYKDHFVSIIGDCIIGENIVQVEDGDLFIGSSWYIENKQIFVIQKPQPELGTNQPQITVYPIISLSNDILIINRLGHLITLKKGIFEKEE